LKVPRPKPQQSKKAKALRWAAGAFAQVAGLSVALLLVTFVLPKSLNPFYPLKADDVIGPLTKWKLQGLALSPSTCRAFLTQAGVTFTDVPDRSEQGFCHVKDAIRMTSGGPPLYPASPVMACPVAAGLVLWQRHGLKEAARDMMGSSVTRIDHLGTYNCRRQYGRKTGWVSEHASANAIDISEFTFLGGEKVSVLKGWNPRGGEPTRGANFLRQAQDRACDIFKVVLGPEANAAHENHFHLDMGPMSSCR
jgi:hypothetical protein